MIPLEPEDTVAGKMEARAAQGDASCAGPVLSVQLLACALMYQRNLLGPVANVADMVDYNLDSPDFIPTETSQLAEGGHVLRRLVSNLMGRIII